MEDFIRWVTCIVIGIGIVALLATNPSKEDHFATIKKEIIGKTSDQILTDMFLSAFGTSSNNLLSLRFSYNYYGVFSTCTEGKGNDKKIVSFGILGKVYIKTNKSKKSSSKKDTRNKSKPSNEPKPLPETEDIIQFYEEPSEEISINEIKDDEFKEFFNKFFNDKEFQLSRIKFPLPDYNPVGGDDEPVKAPKKSKWVYISTLYLIDGREVIDGSPYIGWLIKQGEKYRYSFLMDESCFGFHLTFEKINGKWMLVEIEDTLLY